MSRLIDNSISIYEALQNIKNGKFVMSAFQKQYVWSMEHYPKIKFLTNLKELRLSGTGHRKGKGYPKYQRCLMYKKEFIEKYL